MTIENQIDDLELNTEIYEAQQANTRNSLLWGKSVSYENGYLSILMNDETTWEFDPKRLQGFENLSEEQLKEVYVSGSGLFSGDGEAALNIPRMREGFLGNGAWMDKLLSEDLS